MLFTKNSVTSISLDSAGLIALADLTTVSERTALIGTSWYLDALFLAPGLHRQQHASEVNAGEFPVAGAMTTGYVFRIENQATVYWLQRVGRPGHLVNAYVERSPTGFPNLTFELPGLQKPPENFIPHFRRGLRELCRDPHCLLYALQMVGSGVVQGLQNALFAARNIARRSKQTMTEVREDPRRLLRGIPRVSRAIFEARQRAFVFYAGGIVLTAICFAVLICIRDFWAMGVLVMLVVARAVNVIVFRRRAVAGWKGAEEQGERGDLLILLSQDRWVRLRGMVDDIKLVTSGQWVRELEPVEGSFVAGATLLVYGAAALAPNSSTIGSLFTALLLLFSSALLGVCNAMTKDLRMFGCRIYQCGEPKAYVRRKHMADEMIEEHKGRRDWAVAMGLVLAEPGEKDSKVVL